MRSQIGSSTSDALKAYPRLRTSCARRNIAVRADGGASGGASSQGMFKKKFQSSWDAKSAKGGERDYLYELGKSQDVRLPIDPAR